MRVQEAVEARDDVVGVVAVDEAFTAVVDEPAVNVCAQLVVLPVVFLPAPETQTQTYIIRKNMFI